MIVRVWAPTDKVLPPTDRQSDSTVNLVALTRPRAVRMPGPTVKREMLGFRQKRVGMRDRRLHSDPRFPVFLDPIGKRTILDR